MPLVRRKQVAMHSLPHELVDNPNDTRDVFYLEETGEIFLDYESYASRMSFYKMKVFQCETTGKGGLDYFQALHSEQTESSNLLARFPEPLKVAVLRSVQWRIVGRLDSLVDQVYDRYVDRYHAGEKIFVDIQGEKYWARILKVFPPKALVATWSAYNGNNVSSSTNPNMLTPNRPQPNGLSPLNPNYTNPNSPSGSNHYSPHNEHPPAQADPISIAHRIGGDLSLPPNEALAKDDPSAYFYQVQLIEEGDEDDLPEANGASVSGGGGTKWAGSTMEVQIGVMSRDRLAFSKSILRRFIRECVTRDAAIASPWVVKPALATKYGLETEMPSAMRKSMERAKAGELEKRKKVWEDKEDRPSKKVKKQGDGGDDSGRATPISKVKETPTPAPVRRYPIEDLDVVLTDRDRKASGKNTLARNSIYQVTEVPFGEWGPGASEKFLMVWSILTTFGKPLQLSFFTMDEFEQALNHAYTPPTQSKFPRLVPLMAEIHGTLLLHICDRADKQANSVWEYSALYNSLDAQEEALHMDYDRLTVVMPEDEAETQAYATDIKQFAKFGGSEEDVQAHVWRTKLGGIKPTELNVEDLRELIRSNGYMHSEWRKGDIGGVDERTGWEFVLLGCLAEYATPETFPRVRSIITQLLRPPTIAKPVEQSDAPKIATLDEPDSDSELESNDEDEDDNNIRWGWVALTPRDKLELLAFLADLAMTSRGIRSFMDQCDARLTTLRKEKIEVNRERKRVAELLEEAGVSVTKMEEKMNGSANQNGDTDEIGDATSEAGSASTTPLPESGTTTRRKSRTAPNSTAPSSHTGTPESTHPVNQRAAARAQAAEHKGLVKQRQAHIDEAAKLEKQLAEIEREFRQLLGATRMKPLGKDRFHNRLWWFDGIAGVGMGGRASEGKGNKGKGRAIEKEREREAQGVGRIFLQGPEKGEWEFVMNGRDERAVQARRIAEEGEEYMLEPGEWAMYAEPEQVEEFIAWLNPKGTRELHLKNAMAKWGEPLMAAVGKRSSDKRRLRLRHAPTARRFHLPNSDFPSTMPSDTPNQRSYAGPMQTTGTPIRYGTPIGQGTQLMGTPIPGQRLRMQGGDPATPRRGSFSGRMRAASLSVRDAIGSYQHSQAQLYGSFLGSPSNISHMRRGVDDEEANISEDGDLTDEEECSDEEEEEDGYDVDEDRERDDELQGLDAQHLMIRPGPALSEYGTSPRSILREPGSVASSPDERRLLLASKVPSYSDNTSDSRGRPRGQTFASTASPLTRRLSIIGRRKSISRPPRGSSSYGQTLFNAIAILLGVGMLSEPLAFAYAGWIGGFMLITFYGFLTCYTAKILARIILSDGRLRTYADIGQKAFGPKSNAFTSSLFCLELFSLRQARIYVVLVVLFSDSMHAVAPQFSSHEYKVLGLIILLPSIFLPLHLLSFASLLGILATVFIIVVIFVDGFSKTQAPGSLWEAAQTDLAPNWAALPVSFGLFMAGFAGHAVIPSLARDMAEPEHFDSMINWAFFVATLIYGIVGAGGYVMFGRDVSDEVSVDLMKIPEYNQTLNKIAVWMLVISPLTKFALCTRPLNVTIEIMLGIEQSHAPAHSPERPPSPSHKQQANIDMFSSHHAREQRNKILRAIERTSLALAVVAVAILFPEFGVVMAFLGAFSAFMLCVIGPICAKSALNRKVEVLDGFLLVVAVGMAAVGTWVAFATGKGA
ncbi:unnamed protein product [Rhizoctonia solani]|uniref:Imitation switch two complex protein 1 n=1 Tax=Rhizoctonia solani TaxID=456999 RepID=A0A8H3ALW1_9AGAM|nr:unnamed protein product [Rhizoctonia solani]